jgi:hypothetical protein
MAWTSRSFTAGPARATCPTVDTTDNANTIASASAWLD